MSVVVLTVPGMVLATLLPTRCPVCGAAGSAPCGSCVNRMRPAVTAPVPPGLDACGSLLAYEGAARTLVTSVKYRNDRGALAWLADGVAALGQPTADLLLTRAPPRRGRPCPWRTAGGGRASCRRARLR